MTQPFSFHLSLPAREALKAGLAMAVTCGVAMGLGWPNPIWACLAVAVVSMPTVGESITRGVHRLLGTIMGGMVALLIAGLFPQDRWIFLACLSLWIGFAAYRMTVSRTVYVWFISGYVGLLIASYVDSGPQNLFNVFTARIQETALGIIVYAVISTLIWPQKSSADLGRLLTALLDTQKAIFDHYLDLMAGQNEAPPAASLYAEEAQLVARLSQRLNAAETEQFEAYEARRRWRSALEACQALMEGMELWRDSLAELHGESVAALFPGLEDFRTALLRRLDLAALPGGPDRDAIPEAVPLVADRERMAELPHHRRAVIRNIVHVLERMERVTLSMASGEQTTPASESPRIASRLPDADSFMALFHTMLAIWMGALFWIYVDVPGHLMFIVFVGVFSVIALMAPQMNWLNLFVSEVCGTLLAGLLYIFVMPHLSGYFELAVVLFLLTSVLYYVFWHPRMTMLKMTSIMPFLLLTNIQGEPNYSFAAFANSATAMLLSLVFAGLAFNTPYSQRPEKMFLRLTRRYFRQAGRFLEGFTRPTPPGEGLNAPLASLARMRASTGKIDGWGRSIDYRLMPDNPPETTSALVASLNSIFYRFKMLADAGLRPLPLNGACRSQAAGWEAAIADALAPWALGRFEETAVPALHSRLAALEAGLDNALAAFSEADEEAYAGASRLLGCYRALYRALITFAEIAAGVDWDHWRESRF